MTFITNNLSWAASSITDLYKRRWAIEAFFKQIKQTLQLCMKTRDQGDPLKTRKNLFNPWGLFQFIPHPYKEKKCFSKLETRNRAINSISLSEKTFNLLFSNCEHWATWCKTGKSKSTQIRSVMLESAIGIGLSIAGNPRAGAFLLSRSFRKHSRF